MTTDMATKQDTALLLERVVVGGDLSKLTATERMQYYAEVCKSVGLNPLTQPFQYLYLNNRMVLYARKEAKEQLRQMHGINIYKLERDTVQEDNETYYEVTAYGRNSIGREDSDLGVVCLTGLRGQDRANAKMKAVTKAKGRLTLSLCGLGMLDESEVEVPPTAVTATEVVTVPLPPEAAQAPMGSQRPTQSESEILFLTPEEDRAGFIQRARIAGARMSKDRLGQIKEKHGINDYAKADLAALVSLVRELEEEKL